MRASPLNPMTSAWEALCGQFDINATPIAPLGMKVLVHDTPENRGTWQAHGKLGFYTGRALRHYRCHTVWMHDSRATRISDCLSWHPVLLKMPGSSPLEEITAAVSDVRRILTKFLESPVGAHASQPLIDEAMSDQLRDLRELFQPPSAAHNIASTAPIQRVVAPLTPPGIPLPTQAPPTTLFVPTWSDLSQQSQTPVATAQLQRVPAPTSIQNTAPVRKQRVSNKPPRQPANQQRSAPAHTTTSVVVPPASPLIIPLQSNQPVRLPPKPRTQHHYLNLSPAETKQVSKANIKCVGMQFIDDKDPDDTATGVVVSIVRHKKSRKLAFRYWDHTIFDQAPTKAADFNYLDVNHAVTNCRWTKPGSKFPTVASVILEDLQRNRGPSRNMKKKFRRRQRQPTPWYHQLHLRANAAKIHDTKYQDFRACTALD